LGEVWNTIALQPVTNVLIVLSHYFSGNVGAAIIVLTIIIRGAMFPLTLKQLHASKAMQGLQPKLAELQKKYARDRQRLAQEQMRLYKESGVSPTGCMIPMLIQMPIWIALYQSIIRVLALTPESFLGLSQHLYSWPVVYATLPLGETFLWMHLAVPDTTLALPILVGATMWVQQKMVASTTGDPQQQQQAKLMLWMMPIMFGFLSMQFPSGLALYWLVSNIMSIVTQYFVTGWGGLISESAKKPGARERRYERRMTLPEVTGESTVDIERSPEPEEGIEYEGAEDHRQDRRTGYSTSLRAVRHRSRTSRSRHTKRK